MAYTKQQFKEWGAAGGKARKAAMTPAQRKASARKAARARWAGKRNKS